MRSGSRPLWATSGPPGKVEKSLDVVIQTSFLNLASVNSSHPLLRTHCFISFGFYVSTHCWGSSYGADGGAPRAGFWCVLLSFRICVEFLDSNSVFVSMRWIHELDGLNLSQRSFRSTGYECKGLAEAIFLRLTSWFSHFVALLHQHVSKGILLLL